MSGSTNQWIVYFKFLITMNYQDASNKAKSAVVTRFTVKVSTGSGVSHRD